MKARKFYAILALSLVVIAGFLVYAGATTITDAVERVESRRGAVQ